MKIGAQLFTLYDHTQTLDDLANALARVADMGYTTVQVSGTCAFEPDWMKEQLQKNGLECVITHSKAERMVEMPDTVFDEHAVFGCSRMGIGSCPIGVNDEGLAYFVNNLGPVAKHFKERGGKLYYHNHWREFIRGEDNKRFMEKLCAAIPADELGIILDTYWVQYSGSDVTDWIEKLTGRVDCVHFKDMSCFDNQPRMMPIGDGNMNWDKIIAACEKAGTKYALVEQDNCNGEDPFMCLKRSYDYLHSLGLK